MATLQKIVLNYRKEDIDFLFKTREATQGEGLNFFFSARHPESFSRQVAGGKVTQIYSSWSKLTGTVMFEVPVEDNCFVKAQSYVPLQNRSTYWTEEEKLRIFFPVQGKEPFDTEFCYPCVICKGNFVTFSDINSERLPDLYCNFHDQNFEVKQLKYFTSEGEEKSFEYYVCYNDTKGLKKVNPLRFISLKGIELPIKEKQSFMERKLRLVKHEGKYFHISPLGYCDAILTDIPEKGEVVNGWCTEDGIFWKRFESVEPYIYSFNSKGKEMTFTVQDWFCAREYCKKYLR